MAYCGSVGSVNVLAIMSADLFDETQENPFLLQSRSPSPFRSKKGASQQAAFINKEAELPWSDTCGSLEYDHQPCGTGFSFKDSSHSQPTSPQSSVRRTVSFVNPGATPRGNLSRRSSSVSEISAFPSSPDQNHLEQRTDKLVDDNDLYKLISALSRLGLTDDTSEITQDQLRKINLILSREKASDHETLGSVREGYYSCDETDRRSNMSKRSLSKRKSSCVLRQELCTSPGTVPFRTVKNLLRGGGVAGRTTLKGGPDAQHSKIASTISSRLKVNQKFVRPAILTDAFNRVSVMKLGTRSLKVQAKHITLAQQWDKDLCDREEVDSGMPSPKGQLRNNSTITLDTLDKIGTRAACPVHLLDKEKADYSRVSARVDCYNNVRSPKRNLQRPSTWLVGAALDAHITLHEKQIKP
ncbi:hypothetical protein Plhal304r1_c005g0020691 [Plasmopara halstedii]